MGFDVSWAAFNKVRKPEVLAAAGLRDTGRREENFDVAFSCTELPTGWTILSANDSTYTYNNIGRISANHAVLSIIIQDFRNFSMASFHVRGEQAWSVVHDGSVGVLDLTLTGAVPPQTIAIRDRLLSLPKSDAKARQIDHMFDLPVELAKSICGYRHDLWRYPWGEPLFTEAVPIGR